MSKKNANRWRCLTVGCNPKLFGEVAANDHTDETGHRTAKWPVRSPEGERRARIRNKTGYYDKYNKGAKHATVRLPKYRERVRRYRDYDFYEGDHPFSAEALGQD